MARLSSTLGLILMLSALASQLQHAAGRIEGLMGNGSDDVIRMLQGQEPVQLVGGKPCPPNFIVDPSKTKCIPGYIVRYCKSNGKGGFVPTSYRYYGKTKVVNLKRSDAIRPGKGEVAMTGRCEDVVDENCNRVSGFTCESCCWITRKPISLTGVSCFKNPLLKCNPTFSAFSATCGVPASANTQCSVCVPN